MNNVLAYLTDAAEKYPERIALDDGTNTITYKEYAQLAELTGQLILECGVKAGDFVGVIAARDVYTPIMFMGVLWAGGAYVPIDPAAPKEKQDKIISSAGIKVVINCGDVVERISKANMSTCAEYVVSADGEHNISSNAANGEQPLCVIYTSGSTGTPKGVLKTHEAMIDFVESFTRRFPLKDEVIGNQTPFFFDASAKDIYLALKNYDTLQIIPTAHFSFPVKLVEYLNQKRVSTIFWVPSALSIVARLGTFDEIVPEFIKNVFFVGETFAPKYLNVWRKALAETRFVNLYGSTEIAGVCCYYEVRSNDTFDEEGIIPIGVPFDNSEITLIDDEICVASKALFREYVGERKKTDEAFVNADTQDGEKRYLKTGDYARVNDMSEFVFVSRRDFQIKHMGHRIELGEIEAAAKAIDFVTECGCVYDKDKSRIVLFCQCAGADNSDADIKTALSKRLSAYMLPKVVIVDNIPLNPNGKVDRIALQNLKKHF